MTQRSAATILRTGARLAEASCTGTREAFRKVGEAWDSYGSPQGHTYTLAPALGAPALRAVLQGVATKEITPKTPLTGTELRRSTDETNPAGLIVVEHIEVDGVWQTWEAAIGPEALGEVELTERNVDGGVILHWQGAQSVATAICTDALERRAA